MHRLALSLLFTLLAQATALAQTESDEPRPPNILLIMADDVGVEAFGSYGGLSYETPVLDRLAAEGVRFTRCHAQPLCTPSRIKIMTGRSNARNYAGFSILDPSVRTFGHVLGDAGYATAVAGKWQLLGAEHYGDAAGTGSTPTQAGFDEYCLWQVAELGSRYWDPRVDRNGEFIPETEGAYGPDLFVEFLSDFAARHADEPFLLYYPMALVHNPFPPTPLSADRASEDRAANFADMMTYMDRCVGELVSALEALGLRDDTIVIFTSDNGTNKAISSETTGGTVRGGKGLTNHRGTHVPLIVSWPGGHAGGTVCDDLVDLSDILPTIVEAAGAGVPPSIDGVSFLPQLRGETGTPREWIYTYYNPRPGNARFPERRFVLDGRFKLYADGGLFDVVADPEEEHPLRPDALGATDARERLGAVLDRFPASSPLLRQP